MPSAARRRGVNGQWYGPSGGRPASRNALLTVREVDTVAGFEELRPHWEALEHSASRASVFMSWTWQFLWWKHYGAGKELMILVAEQGPRVVGIWPLYRRSTSFFWLFAMRLVKPLGVGGDTTPDDLEPLLDREFESAAASALVGHLFAQRARWNRLVLSDLSADGPLLHVLTTAAGSALYLTSRYPSARISYLPLPGSWSDLLARYSRTRRKGLKRWMTRFERQPGAAFVVCCEPGDLMDEMVSELIRLHHLRWRGRADKFSFATAQYTAFHRELIPALAERDQLRLYGLRVNGRFIAVDYCYRYRGSIFSFQGGFDPAFASLRPGTVLLGCTLREAIAAGEQIFDMLRGEYDYKKEWADCTRETVSIEVTGLGFAGLFSHLRQRVGHDLRTWLDAQQATRVDGKQGGGTQAPVSARRWVLRQAGAWSAWLALLSALAVLLSAAD